MFQSSDWPVGKYGIVAADPPWHFRAGRSSRSTENHYPTMHIDEIRALPVRDLAADNCALFLWTTPPFLELSLTVMHAWHFRFVSIAFTWLKLRKSHRDSLFIDGDVFVGLGHTTRKSSEICLLGKRGKPARKDRNVHEIIIAARREHSRKPEAFYQRVPRLYPGPCIELFARETRPGWEPWGNETRKFNASPDSPTLYATDGNHREHPATP